MGSLKVTLSLQLQVRLRVRAAASKRPPAEPTPPVNLPCSVHQVPTVESDGLLHDLNSDSPNHPESVNININNWLLFIHNGRICVILRMHFFRDNFDLSTCHMTKSLMWICWSQAAVASTVIKIYS
eukprot:g41517.t1